MQNYSIKKNRLVLATSRLRLWEASLGNVTRGSGVRTPTLYPLYIEPTDQCQTVYNEKRPANMRGVSLRATCSSCHLS